MSRMIGRRRFLQFAIGTTAAAINKRRGYGQAGQTVSTVGDSGTSIEAPSKGYYPYSGVSGAGHPLTPESGGGGWHSGSAGVAYKGSFPPPYPTQPWLSYATGSAVKRGLLPPILPLLDVHVRDTIVCLGGDRNYYMTGSTGDNIWAFNDGVELWRSPDLKKWEYLGLVRREAKKMVGERQRSKVRT
jgi:xylan 1,4-beta-xylosidase